ncbi:MAG: DNA gyrase C-terminal beta-propeller domain-containing protein, partial [bacterium]|nr:DNA gyrase C-terminal beta-propeller domain-containing protein [bacterium]
TTFGVIMLSIVGGQPRTLNLKEMLTFFIEHRKEVVIRRTAYDLKKAEERAHILEGLKIALANIDEIIALIKKAKSPVEAKEGLMKKYKLSEIQSQAILDMRLQRLTALEREKILEELEDLVKQIKRFKEILKSEKLILEIIGDELIEMKKNYANPRRTEIQGKMQELSVEDLIAEEDMVVTLSHSGYIKRNPISVYRAQRRGGRGKMGMETRDEDFVSDLFVASTHSYVLIFTNKGKVFWLKVHEIPQAGRTAKGKAIVNLIPVGSDEKIAAILPVKQFEEGKHVIFATKKGIVKKTDLMAYANPRTNGIIALGIEEGDDLIQARLVDGKSDIFLGTRSGLALRFHDDQVRSMGRSAVGVIGIRLDKDDAVVGMEVINEGAAILTVTEKGFGKRTTTSEYRVQGRGGRGIITIKTTDKNGSVVGVKQVTDDDDIMIITSGGKIIRLPVKQVSVIGRNTQGVRLIQLEKDEHVGAFEKL